MVLIYKLFSSHVGAEEGRPLGPSMDSSRRMLSGPILNSGSYAKQKNPVATDSPLKDPAVSSIFMGRTSAGSSRRAAGVSSHDVFAGSEADPQRSRATEASPGAIHKISSEQRSPLDSSDGRHTSAGRNNSSLVKNYETTLKGIESLNFDGDEKVNH